MSSCMSVCLSLHLPVRDFPLLLIEVDGGNNNGSDGGIGKAVTGKVFFGSNGDRERLLNGTKGLR